MFNNYRTNNRKHLIYLKGFRSPSCCLRSSFQKIAIGIRKTSLILLIFLIHLQNKMHASGRVSRCVCLFNSPCVLFMLMKSLHVLTYFVFSIMFLSDMLFGAVFTEWLWFFTGLTKVRCFGHFFVIRTRIAVYSCVFNFYFPKM